jgi:two-component system response regulator AtoC
VDTAISALYTRVYSSTPERQAKLLMSGYRILVVDDKRDLAQEVAPVLNKLSDNIAVAYSAEEAIEMLDAHPADVVLSDVRMPGRDGLPFLDVQRERWPSTRVILFAENGTVESAVSSMKRGAFDYLTVPFDRDELLVVTGRALKEIKDEEEISRLRAEVHQKFGFHGIYTRDRGMLRIIDAIRRIAASNTTVLICGESGTGKELVAHAIHAESLRAGPVVVFNATGFLETQASTELFGRTKESCADEQRRTKGLDQTCPN